MFRAAVALFVRYSVILSLLLVPCLGASGLAMAPHSYTKVQSVATHHPIVITDNGDFQVQGWPGNGSVQNPYTISELSIVSTNSCIRVSDTTAHFTIRDCELSTTALDEEAGTYPAIWFDNVSSGLVSHCTLSGEGIGAFLESSLNVTIDDCYFHSSISDGIWMTGSSDCVIDSCLITGCGGDGIELWGTSHLLVSSNTIDLSGQNGIAMDECSHSQIVTNVVTQSRGRGLMLSRMDLCVIANNDISGSGSPGIYMYGNSCLIANNTVIHGASYGIDVEGISNTFYGNRIGWNTAGDARDRGGNNTWDNSANAGNYWASYFGIGVYAIPGEAGSIDRYPMAFPGTVSPFQVILVIAAFPAAGVLVLVVRRARSRRKHGPVIQHFQMNTLGARFVRPVV